ncbi:polymeric immunoglobulin receptor-like isoform X1 [Chiloscyllium plagiosum]|uniref:polymeric immunoglobulin receptor-like isoform X1 n=1 Tax=Chiloscyllium plagiosum TaxID=36176 RepID=UPI001CB83C1E|nr:polymeric immunoglobulin receptor-like isoform X1 [Chiloscyllium plagiosum]
MICGTLFAVTLSVCVTLGQDTRSVLIQSPKTVTVNHGGTVTFHCDLRSSNVDYTVDKYDVHWHHSRHGPVVLTHFAGGGVHRLRGFSERFQLSREVTSNSYILTIRELQLSDTNTYICQIWGTVFGKGTQLNVTNRDTWPVLIQSPEAVSVPEGGTVTFHCDLRSSNVNYTVDIYTAHWHHSRHGSIILTHFAGGGVSRSRGFSERFQLSRNVTSNSFILTIRELQLSDTNTYICEIWGKVFGKGTRLNVTSANVPVLLQSPILERVTEDHTARLQCIVMNAAVTHTDVHWYREQPENNTEWVLTHDVKNIKQRSPGFTERFQSSRDPSSNSFILTITNVQPCDTGVYYCKVWGDINGNGTQLTVTEVNHLWKTKLIWFILGALFGNTAVILFIGYTCLRKKHSITSQSGAANDLNTTADYGNMKMLQNAGDFPEDSNAVYSTLQPMDQSVYSNIKETGKI